MFDIVVDVTRDIQYADEDDTLQHYGTLQKSGRYPWGSGGDPAQRNRMFSDHVNKLRKDGLTDPQIAEGMGLKSTQFRAKMSIAGDSVKREDAATALKLKESGMSNVAIGLAMGGRNESSVRAMLAPATQEKEDILKTTSAVLRNEVKDKGFLDIGVGTENYLGVSQTRLNTAVEILKEEGYSVDSIKTPQLGTGKFTKIKVLSMPGTEYKDIIAAQNEGRIGTVAHYSEDMGRSFSSIKPPVSVKDSRLSVRYKEEGGDQKDGVIELRRGVADISLGDSRYAQVRIQVNNTHYLKGMAMYTDDLPDGIDMRFNTNKSATGNKLDALKPLKRVKVNGKETDTVDPDLPFGSIIRQKTYIDPISGKSKLSPLNIVGTTDPDGNKTPGEEGAWYAWSRTLSSQMLSKQSPALAKQQLGIAFDAKKAEYDEIMALNNPAVKRKLLEQFSDGADASAVHLKAAGLPRTRNHVILPISSLKDTEIYAPQYNNGEKVVLIRHPHGGIFEIPELTVNNRNKDAKRLLQNAVDAVGINAKVAARLSGADFDGDTVLVIPNVASGKNRVRNKAPLEELKDFDPQASYKGYPGMPKMRSKQQEMGKISNLITDMTIQIAPDSEIARAVKHSMVVIDAEKHNLDYKRSAQDNGIAALKTKYQGGPTKGATTLISRVSSDTRIPERKDGFKIDPQTGRKIYTTTGSSYTTTSVSKKTGVVTEKVNFRTSTVKKGEIADDAFDLVSKVGGTPMEAVYATHSNQMKALANQARKSMVTTPPIKYNKGAAVTYKAEVSSLTAKLNIALRNAPLERQAQLIGNASVTAKRQANPEMDTDELKKIKTQALANSRARTGAKKQAVVITDDEWSAIQAGAITNNRLNSILKNADQDRVRELATPRERTVMPDAKVARAKAMLLAGRTQAEVASALGVPTSTLNEAINR
jgi:hypothetical protein